MPMATSGWPIFRFNVRERRDIRLFFALWPNENVREQIAAALKTFSIKAGRRVPRSNWHMTLHFIGNTSFEEKDCLHDKAGEVRAQPFQLLVDRAGYFKKPKILWLGCQQPAKALFDLQGELGARISHCEYQPETRPYSPHITVLRKVYERPQAQPFQPVPWRVDRFVLIESVTESDGIRYRVLEEYPLDKAEH